MEEASILIEAISKLIETLTGHFGNIGTILLFIGCCLAFYFWRRWVENRKDKYFNKLIEEKDKTIQRLAESERSYRAYFFLQHGMTTEQIDKFVVKNNFGSVPEAREGLERKD